MNNPSPDDHVHGEGKFQKSKTEKSDIKKKEREKKKDGLIKNK